jgi:hypothetical protein
MMKYHHIRASIARNAALIAVAFIIIVSMMVICYIYKSCNRPSQYRFVNKEYSVNLLNEWHMYTHSPVFSDFIVDGSGNVYFTSGGECLHMLDNNNGSIHEVPTYLETEPKQRVAIRGIEQGNDDSVFAVYRFYGRDIQDTKYHIGLWEPSGIIKNPITTMAEPINLAWVREYDELWYVETNSDETDLMRDTGGSIHIMHINDEFATTTEEEVIAGKISDILAVSDNEVMAIEYHEDSKDVICNIHNNNRTNIEVQDCRYCELIGKDNAGRYLMYQYGECEIGKYCPTGRVIRFLVSVQESDGNLS